jgi:hypothetical protein
MSLFAIGAGELALFLPIMALSIPIIAITAHHFQRMAEIRHNRRAAVSAEEFAALQVQVQQLKELVEHQTLALELARGRPVVPTPIPTSMPPPPPVEQRLSST